MKLKFSYRQGVFISIFSFFVSLVIFSFIIKFPLKITLDLIRNSVNTIYFAILAIASVGIGLSYSDYELVKLKIKREEVSKIPDLPEGLADKIGFDINDKIGKTEKIFTFHQRFNFVVIVGAFACVIVSELNEGIKGHFILKVCGLSLAFSYICSFLWLMLYKRYLINMVTNEYDATIKSVKLIKGGDYGQVMPP
jgi:hypothetical protein